MGVLVKMSRITDLIAQAERELLGPIIKQEKFDVLIKMAEGFHALAEKGYPGCLAFLNDIMSAMGEQFQREFQNDDEELLELQGLFLQGLKNNTFYAKKLRQFSERTKSNNPEVAEKVAENAIKARKFGKEFLYAYEDLDFRFAEMKKEFEVIMRDNKLDIDGLGFIVSIDTALSNLNKIETAKKGVNIGGAVITATEKKSQFINDGSIFSRVIMRIAMHVIRATLTKHMLGLKNNIEKCINSIKSSPHVFLPQKPVHDTKQSISRLEQLWQYLYSPSKKSEVAPENIEDLIKGIREQLEEETMVAFEKVYGILDLLIKKGKATSNEHLSLLKKMEALRTDYQILARKENLESKETRDKLQDRKTELFKEALTQLKELSSISTRSGNTELLALSEILKFLTGKIGKMYRIETGISEGYEQFKKAQSVTYGENTSEHIETKYKAIKKRFGNFLKDIGLKKILDENISQASIALQMKILGEFSERLKIELASSAESAELEKAPRLKERDILEDISSEMEIYRQLEEEHKQAVLNVKQGRQQHAKRKEEQSYHEAGVDWVIFGLSYVVQATTGTLGENQDELESLDLKGQDINNRINLYLLMREAISGQNTLETDDYMKLNKLHTLFIRLGDLQTSSILSPNETADEIFYRNLEVEQAINEAIKTLTWKHIGMNDRNHFNNRLNFANAVLTYLETSVDPSFKSEQVQKLEKDLKEKVDLYKKMTIQFKSFDFKNISDQILPNAKHVFLEKIIVLLNQAQYNNMLDFNKMAILIGSLNYLDKELPEKSASYKDMVRKMREEILVAMDVTTSNSYVFYRKLEKGGENALQQFIAKNAAEFKAIPIAQKLTASEPTPAKTMLYQKAGAKKQPKNEHPVLQNSHRKLPKNKPDRADGA